MNFTEKQLAAHADAKAKFLFELNALAVADAADAADAAKFVADSKESSARFGENADVVHIANIMLGAHYCELCRESVALATKCPADRFGRYHTDLCDIKTQSAK